MSSDEGVPFTLPEGCALFSDLCYTVDRKQIELPKGCYSWIFVWYAFVFLMMVLVPAFHGCASVALDDGVLANLDEVPQHARALAFSICSNPYSQLQTWEFIALGGSLFFFIVFEGYIGFHRNWAPATVRRCFLIGYVASAGCCSSASNAVALTLAPFFAAGFFYAPCR